MGLGEDGQRRVMPHGKSRLHGIFRHGKDLVLHILVGVAEHLVEPVADLLGVNRDLVIGDRKLVQMQQISVQPFPVGPPVGIVGLALLVGDDPLLLSVDQQDPAGLQAGFFYNTGCRNIQDADLGGQDEAVVIRDVIAGGPKSVPVQGRAQDFAVCKKDRGRSVPGLHHSGVIVIKIPLVLAHEGVVLPGLGDDDHHGQGQGHAVHVEEFQGIVQHGGVRTAPVYDGEDLVDILLHNRAGHGLLSGQHPVDVAADGIDLTVVGDHAVRVGPVPGRGRVCGKTRVHNGDRGHVIRRLQVVVEAPQLADQEHTLVYYRP